MEVRQTVEIRVRGTVQGVGFRPTVWRLACDEGLVGEVFNDGFGVLIRTTGNSDAISQFLTRLHSEAPPLSQIENVETQVLNLQDFEDFRIAESVSGENCTRVTPDAAICAACRAEVLDPSERRYGYPFANCTHCGPRFSIVKEVPYDRVNTTMVDFPMCADCHSEYLQPADRRFHAQPIACPACGPTIWLEAIDPSAMPAHPVTTKALDSAIELLRNGAVLAIRGLGGFHLACDATNPEGSAAFAPAQASLRQTVCADGQGPGCHSPVLQTDSGRGGVVTKSRSPDRVALSQREQRSCRQASHPALVLWALCCLTRLCIY
jgi:hydrogenase maturation protein HypF